MSTEIKKLLYLLNTQKTVSSEEAHNIPAEFSKAHAGSALVIVTAQKFVALNMFISVAIYLQEKLSLLR